ncbi:hypothetical protein PC118_g15065 [Phytophthora cactorum]|uniref:F5/8 type C domain-containing protein n=1 Tax=Phytophthora cactorum TaxID=29920 RepID=A0A8T0YUU5_9STRA|nr:hypothetical protein PC111_g13986 [Phytophthora cactorum]KAG2852221.1 hypothetical protein PC113_g15215 [Phytophthora cactorum]KAG2973534.1 hypothetical protein PC118_g15065 [Phytophthora cactorum]
MTVSSSSEATSTAAPTASAPADESTDASMLRTFAVIMCNECQYLEFPGCDVHGALYTQRLADPDGKLHAKCPSCTAATNNARPFRDGCRRCKAPTTVAMWACSLQEIQQAIEAFPVSTEEIEHTVINCERCLSAIFPRAREVLTTRSILEPLAAASGKPLKVANFQLSMPHVDGCLRKGMPLQAVAVQLPKSELKFVVERISRCPLAPRLTGKPQYRLRKVELVTQQNHLHQVAIQLLSAVIGAFDADSPAAVQPLRQVVAVLGRMEPLTLFSEWSPPRQLSLEKVFPKEVTSSSVFDVQHAASKVLESDSSFWRSASKTDEQSPQSDEWIVCQFSSAATLSSIELKWKTGFVPENFSLSISRDGMSYETVAIVAKRIPDNRILVPKGIMVTSFKITIFSSGMVGETFGLESIVCKEAAPRSRASSSAEVAACVRQDWDHLDLLSEDGKQSAQVFMKELATSIQRVMIGDLSHGRVLDPHFIEQVFLVQEDEDTSSNKDAINGGSSASLVTLLVGRQNFLSSVKRRSQLGMIVLHMLSELSAWQMKRMQKAEELTGKRELELMQLEEPFSMEICPDFFAISHRLLGSILSRWLPGVQERVKIEGKGSNNATHGTQDVYDALASSFVHFRADAELQGAQNGVDSPMELANGGNSDHSKLSPDGLCVAVLEIITSNLRRLVLSRIDPVEIGISPASVCSEDDLPSAPPALNPTVASLEQLIALGTKRSDAFFSVSLKAAAAIEVGTEAFYPSSHQRTKVLASRMGKGATLEVQVRWPVQERDQEDPRYERLILMLQMECIKLGIRHAIRGSWYFFLHLVVEVPSTRDTEEVLTQHFAPCIQRAGFSSWQVAAGAQELSINLQRHLHWNRVEKMSQDSGAGWIRVYPADVAAYDEVLADVEGFLAEHGKCKPMMARP